MSQDKMRAEYEAAVILAQCVELRNKSELFSVEMAEIIIRSTWLERDGERYKAPMAQMGWWAWQHARALVVVVLPKRANTGLDTGGWPMDSSAARFNEAIDNCRKAIEAAGVKVAT